MLIKVLCFLQVFEPTVKSLLANVEILLSGKYDEAEEIQIRLVFLLSFIICSYLFRFHYDTCCI